MRRKNSPPSFGSASNPHNRGNHTRPLPKNSHYVNFPPEVNSLFFSDLMKIETSRQPVSVAAVTPYLRLVASSSAPRSSSNTTVIFRRADHRSFPPSTAGGAAPVALRAPFAPPPAPFLPLDTACSSSPVASHTASQITVQRIRGAGESDQSSKLVD